MQSRYFGRWLGSAAAVGMTTLMLCSLGCASNSGHANPPSDPTTRAMADPMHYSPPDDSDISGGGMTNFDSKAFNKDMDHVLNP
jgi:hypothetical protein